MITRLLALLLLSATPAFAGDLLIRNGRVFDGVRALERAARAVAPKGLEAAVLSDFESGSVTIADGGAAGTSKSLLVSGTIDASLPYAWYGAMWSPTEVPMQPANLSSKKERAGVAGAHDAVEIVRRPRRFGCDGGDFRGRTGRRCVFVSGGRGRIAMKPFLHLRVLQP